MERWNKRVALVTGASKGIGEAISRRLVKQGMIVLGCSRTLDTLQAVAESLKGEKGEMVPLQCDVGKPDDIKRMFDRIRESHGRVDVCVNNAAVLHSAPLLSGNPDEWQDMVNVNVMGLCRVTQEAVRLMREKNIDDGQVIHINSIRAHGMPNSPSSHFYCASKAMVKALLEGLKNELKNEKSHIRVAEVSPGLTETDMPRKRNSEQFKTLVALQPDNVAEIVEFIISTPPHVQIHDVLVRATDPLVT